MRRADSLREPEEGDRSMEHAGGDARGDVPRAQPERATIAVIGAGIVGNCLVGHLAELGWDGLVLLDKGPLPNPGGSTGHASNFIFPTDHNREIAMLTLESQRQYAALGVNTTCGGIEVARTEERMDELRRRMTSARAWGIETELLTPAEVVARVPFVNEDVILGGFHTPSVSVVDSVRAGTIMRERALAKGALTVLDETEVVGLEVARRPFGRPRIRAVVTARGTIAVDQVVIACGVWSPRVAALAGASIPLTPAVHQMANMGPIDLLQKTGNEIGYPIVRDMDTFMYERQRDDVLQVGSYAHRPILVRSDDIPSLAEAERTPTEMPFTADDFAPQLEHARAIVGELLAGSGMQYSVNGLLSLTPDVNQVLGETAEVEGLWSAAAVWIKEGPGTARLIAEWITHGYPRLCDPHGSDVTRFYPHERTEATSGSAAASTSTRPTASCIPASSGSRRAACSGRRSTTAPRRWAPSSTPRAAGSGPSGTGPTRIWWRATASGTARTSGTAAGGRRSSTRSTCTCGRMSASST